VIRLTFVSHVAAKRRRVWEMVARTRGVNDELSPLVRMTFPREVDRLDLSNPVVRRGFDSWVLLFGLLPMDRHRFGFVDMVDGESFDERSHSWLHRSWRHQRMVTEGASSSSSNVRDELTIEPRLRILVPVIRIGVSAVFRHRHARLRQRFGQAS